MSQKIYKNYIGGEFVSSKDLFDDINPVDGSLVAKVAEADLSMVDAAVKSARQALNGEWSDISLKERCNLLNKIADAIEKRFEEFVAVEVADTGKSQSHARKVVGP